MLDLPIDDFGRLLNGRLARPPQSDDLRRNLNRPERVAQFVREHGQKVVLRPVRGRQAHRSSLLLPGAIALAEEGVAEYLEQFAIHVRARASERQFLTDPPRQRGEGNVALFREPPHRVLIGEGGQDVGGDGRTDHLAVEHERAPDDREAVPLLDDNRGRRGGLSQAALNARGEHAQRMMARRQKLKQGS